VELRLDDPRTHYNYAIFLRKMEKYDEAENHYRKALEIDPEFVPADSLLLFFFWRGAQIIL